MAKNISPFISEQFPSFYKEDGQFLIDFAKEYYKWMEQSGNTLYHTRRLPDYFDIDTTSEDFIIHFREKYLPNFALLTETDKRTLVKHCTDIYRSKGSIRAIKLLFKLVYDDSVDVYWPGDDIIRASAGIYKKPTYLEVTTSNRTASYVGKEIVGEQSGARAIVESVSRRDIRRAVIDIVQLSNVRGDFEYGELITTDGIFADAPRITGSLNTLSVTSGGRDFEVGQLLDVTSEEVGYGAFAKVTAVLSQSGQALYELVDGGSGYSTNASIYISERVLGYNNMRAWPQQRVFNTVTQGIYERTGRFLTLETISQPLVNVYVSTASGIHPVGTYIYGVNSSSIIAVGAVVNTTQNSSSFATGTLIVSDRKSSHITLNTIGNADVDTGSFHMGELVYQRAHGDTTNTAIGYVYGANSTAIAVDVQYGNFEAGVTITCEHLTTANASAVTTYSQRFTNSSIDNYNSANTLNFFTTTLNYGATSNKDASPVDRTATATYIGSNTTHLGLYGISTTKSFLASSVAAIKGDLSNTYANAVSLSSGNPGSFDIVDVSGGETLYLGKDELNGNNASSVQYTTLNLNSTEFGFPKSPSANVSSKILDALQVESTTIGTIAHIGNIDPGSYNTIAPIVLVYDKKVAGYGRRNYTLEYTNRNEHPFQVGESVTQLYTQPYTTVTFSTLTGNTQFDVTGLGESVSQIRSDGVQIHGIVTGQSVGGATKTITVGSVYATNGTIVSGANNYANGELLPNYTFNTSNNIVGAISGAVANTISAVSTDSDVSNTQGIVLSINDNILSVKRTRFANPSLSAYGVQGANSQAAANVSSITTIEDSLAMGENATFTSGAGTSNGIVTDVEIISSGYGYAPGEVLTLTRTGNDYAVTGVAGVNKQGTMAGDWQSTDGFLSSDKKIHDSDYYQEFSYEIQSSLSRTTYERKVKDTVHVSGTKMFGAVVSRQSIPAEIVAPVVDGVYDLTVSSVSGFNVNDAVQNDANTTYGIVTSVVEQTNVSFNALSAVSTGQQIVFNSNTDISNGSSATFNAYSSVNEGASIRLNANSSVVANANFTFNANTDVTNAISFTFNANTDVQPGAQVAFTNTAVITGTTVTANAAKVTRGDYVDFNKASVYIPGFDSIILTSNVVSAYRSFNTSTGITSAYSTTFHTTSSAANVVYDDVGSRVVPNPPIIDYFTVSSASTYFSAGDKVKYNVKADYSSDANNAVYGLTDGQIYTVHSANSTALSLIGSDGSNKLQWRMRYDAANTDIRHTITLLTGKAISGANSTIAISNADIYFQVGDTVTYTTNGTSNSIVTLLANTTIANNSTYYIQHANTTVIALCRTANTASTERIPLVPTSYSSTHYMVGYNRNCGLIESSPSLGGKSLASGDVVWFDLSGGTAIPYLTQDGDFYSVQFANATHFALANRSTPTTRLPLSCSTVSSYTVFLANSYLNKSTIQISTANTFSVNDAVIFTYSGVGYPTIGGRQQVSNNGIYYIQFANDTHLALSFTPGGDRIPLTNGSMNVNDACALTGVSTVNANNTFAAGDQVQYYTAPGNTAVSGLTTNSTYYIHTSNSSSFSLTDDPDNIVLTVNAYVLDKFGVGAGDMVFQNNAVGNTAIATVVSVGFNTICVNNVTQVGTFSTSANIYSSVSGSNSAAIASISTGGSPITLARGVSETGHSFIPLGDKNIIQTDGTLFNVGSSVKYFTNGTAIGGLSNGTTYYVSSSNSSSISLSTAASGGVRIALTGFTGIEPSTPTYHNLVIVGTNSTIATSSAGSFAAGDEVIYELANSSLHSLSSLQPNQTYYIQFANATHIALANTYGGQRLSLTKGTTESGHSFRLLTGTSSIIASGYSSNLSAGQPLLYLVSAGNTALTGLSNNTTYYVQFANATHFALSNIASGNRLKINQGVTESGHRFTAGDTKSTIVSTTAAYFDRGDAVKYITSPGNTPLTGFTNNTTYYVQFANDTHIAIATTIDGDRIQLTKGLTENGHFFTPTGTKATIQATNDFTAGDQVMYSLSEGNTSLIGFTNSVASAVVTYYIESANTTHFALSETSGGARIQLYQGVSEAGHTFSTVATKGLIADASASSFANNDQVLYSTDAGNTTLTGLSNNATYYIQFANATHVALSAAVDGPRIPIKQSVTEGGHRITKAGGVSTIQLSTANNFSVGEPVSYHVSSGNTAIGGLSGGTTYYVQFANATHIALANTYGGPRIVLTAGSSETGHTIKDATINTISVSVTYQANVEQKAFTVGGYVRANTYPTNPAIEQILAVNVIT